MDYNQKFMLITCSVLFGLYLVAGLGLALWKLTTHAPPAVATPTPAVSPTGPAAPATVVGPATILAQFQTGSQCLNWTSDAWTLGPCTRLSQWKQYSASPDGAQAALQWLSKATTNFAYVQQPAVANTPLMWTPFVNQAYTVQLNAHSQLSALLSSDGKTMVYLTPHLIWTTDPSLAVTWTVLT